MAPKWIYLAAGINSLMSPTTLVTTVLWIVLHIGDLTQGEYCFLSEMHSTRFWQSSINRRKYLYSESSFFVIPIIQVKCIHIIGENIRQETFVKISQLFTTMNIQDNSFRPFTPIITQQTWNVNF
jgi:hypothetical protein